MLKINVGAAEQPHRPDPMSCLVDHDESEAEEWMDRFTRGQERLVLRGSHNRPPR
jgi:hypothetical protein